MGFHSKATLIKFTIPDIHGMSRSKLLSRDVVDKFKENGFQAYFGTIAYGLPNIVPSWQAVTDVGHGNMWIRPDMSTLCPQVADYEDCEIQEVLCDCLWLGTDKPIEFSPRQALKKQLQALHDRGLTLLSGFEFEFRVYKISGSKRKPLFAMDFSSGEKIEDAQEYLIALTKALKQRNIIIEAINQELGSGMIEATIAPLPGLQAADAAFIFRGVACSVAKKFSLEVTFMTKPVLGETGQGQHYNHSLYKVTDKTNAFYDAEQGGLSELAEHWVSGLITYCKPTMALYCPTVNCYRRLYCDWGPENANWGIEKRLTSFRFKVGGQSGTYVENRLPAMNGNPYLIMAGSLVAGMLGIDEKLKVEQNAAETPMLQTTLQEALEDLNGCEKVKTALGEELVHVFTQTKEEHEIKVLEEKFAEPKRGGKGNSDNEELEIEKEFYWKLI